MRGLSPVDYGPKERELVRLHVEGPQGDTATNKLMPEYV